MKSGSPRYHPVAVAVLMIGLTGCTTAAVTPSRHRSLARTLVNEPVLLPRTGAVAGPAGALHCPRRAQACVDVQRGLAWLQSHGRTTYGPVPIATGTRTHPTPVGNFTVQWKARHWVSTEYDVPMPYSVFFAGGGIAFHEGPLGTHSHGCIHLVHNAARTFFHRLSVGAHVHVE